MSNYPISQNATLEGRRATVIHFNTKETPGSSYTLAYLGMYTNLTFTAFGQATPRPLVLFLDAEGVVHQFDCKFLLGSLVAYAEVGDIINLKAETAQSLKWKTSFVTIRPHLVIVEGCAMNDPSADAFEVPEAYTICSKEERAQILAAAKACLGDEEYVKKGMARWMELSGLDRTPVGDNVIHANDAKDAGANPPLALGDQAQKLLDELKAMNAKREQVYELAESLDGVAGKSKKLRAARKEWVELGAKLAEIQNSLAELGVDDLPF